MPHHWEPKSICVWPMHRLVLRLIPARPTITSAVRGFVTMVDLKYAILLWLLHTETETWFVLKS